MKTVHVAVGVLIDASGAILITRRPDHVHQGGLWEFPGGKVEDREPVAAALNRELHEELGITVQAAEPWLQVWHDYPDQRVLLDVWRVMAWQEEPRGQEGQPLAWALPAELETFAFPAADEPIIAALAPNYQFSIPGS
ncbi:MAG: 8-oxo-dGTP diphosphatase MutT [Gammaproteobacteria bacterium]|nr:8-oxo-dGTP diphosphatase MutT [Gammaproteobacteria bacterium]MCP5196591.1 8-oxo-dGTP diphosphatase MutT [Gammaproteobacteria bacterium]